MGVIEFLLALAQDMILAAIPAVGFAMVFNVPVRALRWCALLGAIGHGSRMILMTSGLNFEWATFLASMLVGTLGFSGSGSSTPLRLPSMFSLCIWLHARARTTPWGLS